MKPVDKLYKEILLNAVPVGRTHRIPTLEMALAAKYAAMVSPNREQREKLQDEVDFSGMVIAHYSDIEKNVLFSLGEMVQNGGGQEVLKFIEDAQAGRRLTR